MKKYVWGALLCLMFLLILLFPKISFSAAKSGLLLWYETLVPTLLPVMFLSSLLLRTNLAYPLLRRLARPFTAFLGVSPYGVYAMVIGFLCGCPMGAKVLSDLRGQNLISHPEGVYLAGFCNNISPAFLIQFLVLQHLKLPALVRPTLCILLGAPLLYGLFSNHRYRTAQKDAGKAAFGTPEKKASATAINAAMVDACISDSISSITKLGAYVILFSVLTAMIDVLPFRTVWAKAVLAGVTEVSGGIHYIASLPLPFAEKYLLLTAVSAFGGLCCTAQSAQMLSRIGLPLKNYLAARLSVTAIAVIMAICYVK